eukprot:36455_1
MSTQSAINSTRNGCPVDVISCPVWLNGDGRRMTRHMIDSFSLIRCVFHRFVLLRFLHNFLAFLLRSNVSFVSSSSSVVSSSSAMTKHRAAVKNTCGKNN